MNLNPELNAALMNVKDNLNVNLYSHLISLLIIRSFIILPIYNTLLYLLFPSFFTLALSVGLLLRQSDQFGIADPDDQTYGVRQP